MLKRKAMAFLFHQNAQTARRSVLCSECLKPRVIYAQHKLTHHDQSVLDRVFGIHVGVLLMDWKEKFTAMTIPQYKTYAQEKLTCEAPVE